MFVHRGNLARKQVFVLSIIVILLLCQRMEEILGNHGKICFKCPLAMATNPYAPPKAAPTGRSRVRTLFERASIYQSRAVYSGFLLMVGGFILTGIFFQSDKSLQAITLGLSSIGGIIFVMAVFLTLPLSIWGIIDGYRDGRKNRRASKN